MEHHKIDERTGWEYELKGDYYYPTGRIMKNGVLSPETIDNEPEEQYNIGVWGQRHLLFIRQYKKSLYLDFFCSGRLNEYLADINAQAEEMLARLIKEIATREGLTERLKAEYQMRWVHEMNRISAEAREIVNAEMIFG